MAKTSAQRTLRILIALMLYDGGGLATAQSPRPSPKLSRVVPPGGQAGQSFELKVGGTDLGPADGLWFSGAGITATRVKDKPETFRVTIDPKTPPGVLDLRVLTPDGVSNPRAFSVGDRPESAEAEPNNDPKTANPIRRNSIVNGTVLATDVDCFAFEGKKGHRVFLDLAAERIDSKLDATIRLLDSTGAEVAESRDAIGADPFLDATLPRDGRYVIKVHDVTYDGSADHVYRLTLHDGPHLDAVSPPVAEPGRTGRFTLIGRNLGGRAIPDRGDDGRPLQAKERDIAPAFVDASGLAVAALGAAVSVRGEDVRLMTEGGISNPVLLAESPGPVVSEREPDGPDAPQGITLPVTVAGTFGTPGDLDAYQFRAKGGETWRVEAVAEGIGSPADPTLVVERVPDKGEPIEVAAADDTPDPGFSPRLNLASVDASLSWKVPADGTYRVVVGDVASASRGGPRLAYRLSIRRERPDFRIFLLTTTPNAPEGLALRKGGRASAIVVAWRREGFAGPIRVIAAGLPTGVRCDPIVIAPGQTVAPVVFEAEASAPTSAGVVRLVGLGATAAAPSRLGFDRLHAAVPVGTVWPLQKGNANSKATVAPIRATRGFVVAVRDGVPFRLSARPRRPVVAQGQAIDLDLTADRSPGAAEPIVVAGADLPPGWAAPAATIPKGETSARLAWAVPKGMAPGLYSLVVRGASTFQPDPKGTTKVKVDEPSNPFLVAVRPAPVALATSDKSVSLKAGTDRAVAMKVDRLAKGVGVVTLRVEFPATSGLAADPISMGAGETSGTITIRAKSDAPAGPTVSGTIRAETTVDGEAIEVAIPISIAVMK